MDGNFISEAIKEFNLPFQNQVLIFSLILFIILLSPIILRKLKIPGIIGLIISGVVIGPNRFNIIDFFSKGIDTVTKIQKGIEHIFKNK